MGRLLPKAIRRLYTIGIVDNMLRQTAVHYDPATIRRLLYGMSDRGLVRIHTSQERGSDNHLYVYVAPSTTIDFLVQTTRDKPSPQRWLDLIDDEHETKQEELRQAASEVRQVNLILSPELRQVLDRQRKKPFSDPSFVRLTQKVRSALIDGVDYCRGKVAAYVISPHLKEAVDVFAAVSQEPVVCTLDDLLDHKAAVIKPHIAIGHETTRERNYRLYSVNQLRHEQKVHYSEFLFRGLLRKMAGAGLLRLYQLGRRSKYAVFAITPLGLECVKTAAAGGFAEKERIKLISQSLLTKAKAQARSLEQVELLTLNDLVEILVRKKYVRSDVEKSVPKLRKHLEEGVDYIPGKIQVYAINEQVAAALNLVFDAGLNLYDLYNPSTHRHLLLKAYLPYVTILAQKLASHLPSSLELDDLISEGKIGLVDAVGRSTSGYSRLQFKKYATIRIQGAMVDYLRRNDRLSRTMRSESNIVSTVYFDDLNTGKKGSRNIFDVLKDDSSPNPAAVYDQADLKRIVGETLEALPDREKLLLTLYYYHGFKQKEIAVLFGIGEPAVSHAKVKAEAHFKEKFKAYVHD